MSQVFLGLYLTISLLAVRNVYRTVQFATGWCVHLCYAT